MQLGFYFNELLGSLPYMGIGMLGIFVVILAIYGCIALLNRFFAPKSKE
ncbi:MAG: hypothetical protein BWY11_01311 [Firmicutes bacterium ADurb.Bin182]|nr:MAG: hypothetical protein BWY11_01311 [Firmicutes bacterium ADurb.Bin182]